MAISNVPTTSHLKLGKTVRRHYMTDEPLMIWGAPGIGKSQIVIAEAESIARSLKREFVNWNRAPIEVRNKLANSNDNTGVFIFGDCRLSQYDPSDWALPWKSEESGSMVWMPSQLLLAYSRPGTAGIMFLDELPQAMPSVQSAAYQITLDRCYKDISFNNIRIIAAGNRASDGGSSYPMSPALASRFNHVELDSPYGKDWVKDWARDAGVHPMVCAFIQARPELLYEQTGKVENRRTAFPCPRAWARCSNLLNDLGSYTGGDESWVQESFDIVAMAVGRGAAMEFQAYLTVLHDVILEDFLEHPEKISTVSSDIQLGIQAMLEGYMKNVASKEDWSKQKKLDELNRALNICDQKLRSEIQCMMFCGIVRGFKKDGKDGWSVITEMAVDAKNDQTKVRVDKMMKDVIKKLTGR